MPMILNALDRENAVTIGGNTFTFKPRQIKHFYQNHIATLITREKSEYGFTDLPDAFEDLEYQKSEEGKATLEEKRKQGVEAYCKRLRELIRNEQVSLRQDLEMRNLKVEPRIFMADGMLAQMEELARYQVQKSDSDQRRIDRIKQLEVTIGETKK